MSTEDDPRLSWRAPAVVGCVLGAALVLAGAVQFVAAIAAVNGRSVLWDLRRGQLVPAETLGNAAEGLGFANRVFMQGDLEADRGFLLLRQADLTTPGPARDALLVQATVATERALAVAPASPGAWARLAYLHTVQDRRMAAVACLRMSFLAGPVVPIMQASRLSLGLELLPYMDQEMREMLSRQVRYAWLAAPEALVPLASNPRTGSFVRDAMTELSASEMENFIRRYTPAR